MTLWYGQHTLFTGQSSPVRGAVSAALHKLPHRLTADARRSRYFGVRMPFTARQGQRIEVGKVCACLSGPRHLNASQSRLHAGSLIPYFAWYAARASAPADVRWNMVRS